MKLIRTVPAALVVLALAACGGAAPTATPDTDLRPRMSGGVGMGSGGFTESTVSSDGTTTPVPSDSTGAVKKGGFIGSGT